MEGVTLFFLLGWVASCLSFLSYSFDYIKYCSMSVCCCHYVVAIGEAAQRLMGKLVAPLEAMKTGCWVIAEGEARSL